MLTQKIVILVTICLAIFICGCSQGASSVTTEKTLELFVGSASKPATEEVARLFTKETGIRVLLHFGGSGKMLSEMKLSARGDIYFPGSSDFMELAKREKLVIANTEKRVVYLIPAINVVKGNPKKIYKLTDLTKTGMRVGIARPDTVCVGLYAVEVLEKAGLSTPVKRNIVTNVESCAKTAQLIVVGSVDAILGWRVFQYWAPKRIETVMLAQQQVPRIGYIPIAVSVFSKKTKLAHKFIKFICGAQARAIFKKWNYITSEKEARRFALPITPIGGEWQLPKGWK